MASVDEDLTGRENLILLGRLYGFKGKGAKARADELLGAFGLEDAATRLTKNYSGGMRRRLDIAASLVVTPDLLFLDEPTTGLDPRSRNQVWDIIRALRETGTTILLCTQYLDEADQLADGIAVIDSGKVIAKGTPGQLKASVGSATLHVRLLRARPARPGGDDPGPRARARAPRARPVGAQRAVPGGQQGRRGDLRTQPCRHRRRVVLARPADLGRGLPRPHRPHRREQGKEVKASASPTTSRSATRSPPSPRPPRPSASRPP